MADDPWRRFRDKSSKSLPKQSARQKAIAEAGPVTGTQEITELIDQIQVMVEQLNHLYNIFLSGAEKRPPVEKRRQLETLTNKLINSPKASATLRFKSTAVVQNAQSYFERWDKMLRGLEKGTIKIRH